MSAMHEIDYKIFGDDMQFVEVELDPNEATVAEAGGMMYMEDGIEMETVFGDGSQQQSGIMDALMGAGKRLLTGESLFMTVFHNRSGQKKKLAFGAPYPGKIIAIHLAEIGGELVAQKDSFLAAAKGVSIGIAFQRKLGVGLFGGEGFIMQRLQGDGWAFVHAGGTLQERTLAPGELIRVDTGCIVAMQPSVNYEIEYVGKIKSALFGGEGLFFATLARSRTHLAAVAAAQPAREPHCRRQCRASGAADGKKARFSVRSAGSSMVITAKRGHALDSCSAAPFWCLCARWRPLPRTISNGLERCTTRGSSTNRSPRLRLRRPSRRLRRRRRSSRPAHVSRDSGRRAIPRIWVRARADLVSLNPRNLAPQEIIEWQIGLGTALFLENQPGPAAEMFSTILPTARARLSPPRSTSWSSGGRARWLASPSLRRAPLVRKRTLRCSGLSATRWNAVRFRGRPPTGWWSLRVARRSRRCLECGRHRLDSCGLTAGRPASSRRSRPIRHANAHSRACAGAHRRAPRFKSDPS